MMIVTGLDWGKGDNTVWSLRFHVRGHDEIMLHIDAQTFEIERPRSMKTLRFTLDEARALAENLAKFLAYVDDERERAKHGDDGRRGPEAAPAAGPGEDRQAGDGDRGTVGHAQPDHGPGEGDRGAADSAKKEPGRTPG